MRGKKVKRRALTTDALYKSRVVARMINTVMLDGKKSIAERTVYGAMKTLSEDPKEVLKVFETAVKNVMPG